MHEETHFICTPRRVSDEEKQGMMLAETKDILARFNTNKDGQIHFREFLHIICLSPWRLLLPSKVRVTVRVRVSGSV